MPKSVGSSIHFPLPHILPACLLQGGPVRELLLLRQLLTQISALVVLGTCLDTQTISNHPS